MASCPMESCGHEGEWHRLQTFRNPETGGEELHVVCLYCSLAEWKEEEGMTGYVYCDPLHPPPTKRELDATNRPRRQHELPSPLGQRTSGSQTV